MDDEGVGLPVETQVLWRWLRQYVRLRWLAIGAILCGMLVARFVLGVGLPLFPVLIVTAAIASYNVFLSIWQRRHERHALEPGTAVRWSRRFAFAHIVTDIVALTVLLHFVGGIDTPFFLFYFFHVGLGSIVLNRRDAYQIMVLAIGLFVLLVGTEFLGWLPHVHVEGFVPLDLYRERTYVATVLVGFVLALTVSTVGTTTVMTELRRQQEQQARTNERELEKIRVIITDDLLLDDAVL